MLYSLDERSRAVSLGKASPDKYELISEFNVPSGGKGPYWSLAINCCKKL
jgi:hypothetical protein